MTWSAGRACLPSIAEFLDVCTWRQDPFPVNIVEAQKEGIA